MLRRTWSAMTLTLALLLMIPAGASAGTVMNESGTVNQLSVRWSGTDGVNSWSGDAMAYMLNGETVLELFGHTITQIADDPMCWEESFVSGFTGPGSMTVARKAGSAYADAILDGYIYSYIFCEPDYEPQSIIEAFTNVEVSIDFVATSPASRVTNSESVRLPGTSNQHARISGELRQGAAEVTYNGITRYAEDATLFSLRYSYHSNVKSK
jgi:hypothetical protein